VIEIPVRLSLRGYARAVDVEAVVQETMMRMWELAEGEARESMEDQDSIASRSYSPGGQPGGTRALSITPRRPGSSSSMRRCSSVWGIRVRRCVSILMPRLWLSLFSPRKCLDDSNLDTKHSAAERLHLICHEPQPVCSLTVVWWRFPPSLRRHRATIEARVTVR